jgi:heme/copper-type cytochrome/quinol oxidase subunit 2
VIPLTSQSTRHARSIFAVIAATLLFAVAAAVATAAQNRREFAVSAHKYAFKVADASTPDIRVRQDDLVGITFSVEDIPHSFTINDDHYRIMRRAEPGKPVRFEFRADKAGRFEFKCTLTIDDRCKEMSGWLTVEGKR